jgi:hypothetical protein
LPSLLLLLLLPLLLLLLLLVVDRMYVTRGCEGCHLGHGGRAPGH